MQSTDTIAAIATAKGVGAIGIVKISGPQAAAIGELITRKKLVHRQARYLSFYDDQSSGNSNSQKVDQGLALFFKAPDSYTGEDVLELHAHGNPYVLDQLLSIANNNGARDASPGEFTERAFLNDKLDLAQAEAVADLIESNSVQAAQAAVRSLSGEFSNGIAAISEQLIGTRVYVEAALDFAEEEIDFLKDDALLQRLVTLRESVAGLLQNAVQGCLLREGLNVVIIGEPNVGKSSLLNRLTGEDTAIVTDIAGTTRDVLREQINIDGLPLNVIDTAGLRETQDKVEQEGVRRAREQISKAELILVVKAAGSDESALPFELPADVALTRVFNKADLAPGAEHDDGIVVSAKTGQGIAELREHLKQSAGYEQTPEGTFMARRRHLNALKAVQHHVDLAQRNLCELAAGELAAEELRMAQQQLNLITGEFTSDDLLGEIFGSFCIGK